MKTSITMVLTILFLGRIDYAPGQSNGNSKVLSFSGRSAKLNRAVGWQQNKQSGEWIQNTNVIDDRESPPYWAGHTSQSFNWIQFASVNYHDQTYRLLLFEKPSGKYKNEKTHEDWETETRTYFFIMSEADFDNLKNLASDKTGLSMKISSNLWGFVPHRGTDPLDDRNLLTWISRSLAAPGSAGDCLILSSKVTNGRTLIRFLLPASCYLVDNVMKTAYFEVTQAEFKKLLE